MTFQLTEPILVIGLGGVGTRLAEKTKKSLNSDCLMISHDQNDITAENSIKILWNEWNYNSESLPTNSQKKIIIGALKYNSDVDGFWLPLLQERMKIIKRKGFCPDIMKYWFEGGFNEMKYIKQSGSRNRPYISQTDLNRERDF